MEVALSTLAATLEWSVYSLWKSFLGVLGGGAKGEAKASGEAAAKASGEVKVELAILKMEVALEKMHRETEKMKYDADKMRSEADKMKSEADKMRGEAEKMKSDSDKMRNEADKLRYEIEVIKMWTLLLTKSSSDRKWFAANNRKVWSAAVPWYCFYICLMHLIFHSVVISMYMPDASCI